ncbi:esterase family protein [Paenibacillus nanensis]|uniref:Esterase family protein n=1 Tax=Paenibacillus nanensis TaxID=393251 RepID=A0A3A1V2E2_9BACL|nr:alpha/beta hydrolase family protein [Paenibacillus nanensis]RIX54001.1 esterase family protein [Paenibacillus nanensis]
MALMSCRFYSETLGLSTSMTVILPEETQTQIGMSNRSGGKLHKTLYLLHGLSDDDSIWTRRTSVERYVSEYGIAVVMPNVHRSFYTDMEYGGDYWKFLTEELPAKARAFFPLSSAREDNFVAGLSMGGYGAFKWALTYPERFAAAGSFSGALDMAGHVKASREHAPNRTFELIFGDKDIAGTDADLLALLKRPAEGGERPLLYQSCGTEDFLYQGNIVFRDACLQSEYQLTYHDGPGDHTWAYWDEHIQHFLKWQKLK